MKSLSVKEINFFFFCMTEFSPLEYSERYKCSPKGKKKAHVYIYPENYSHFNDMWV